MSKPSKTPKFRWSEWKLVLIHKETALLQLDKSAAHWFKLVCSGYYQHNAL